MIIYRARAVSRAEAPRASVQDAPAAADTPPASEQPSPSSSPAAEAPAAPAPAPAAALRLEIAPVSDCWVSLTVDGKKLFARIMPAGEKQTVSVTREATVEIGDAGAFGYSLNGKPGKPLGQTGQVRTLKVSPATAAEFIR